MLVLLQVMDVWGQEISVRGNIVDSNGEPLIGVTVVPVGTTNGVISDIDGNFTLRCAQGTKLRFSFVGYADVERNATEEFMKVVLREDVQALEEVVVVGYGSQKKVNLVGSVAAVKVDEKLSSRSLSNVSSGLSKAFEPLSF